ncbi:MAG: DEAD/DEAH box helicase [Sphaerochaeta sp.]
MHYLLRCAEMKARIAVMESALATLLGTLFAEEQETCHYDASNYSIWFTTPTSQIVLDYLQGTSAMDSLFDYREYTTFQNRIMHQKRPVYRFLAEDAIDLIPVFLKKDLEIPFQYTYGQDRGQTVSDASALEYFFEQRFCEVYGPDALQFLQREYPVPSLSGSTYFVDYVVEYLDGSMIAVEENGVSFHHPGLIGKERYRKQLEKQNICTYLGIPVYRFTSLDCHYPKIIDDQIRQFFGDRRAFRKSGLYFDRSFTLYEHQKTALEEIGKLRGEQMGTSAVLQVFPTATGKSKIVEEDILRYLTIHPDARVLIVGPTIRVANDWRDRMRSALSKSDIQVGDTGNQIVIGTYQKLWSLCGTLDPSYFSYLVVDEAHHAVAPVMRRSLQYFTPDFLIGLTATPDRLDNKRLESVFGKYRTPMDLAEAMEKNLIAKVRAYRIQSNLDLTEVRFNGHDFVNADLERTLRVDSRNHLIVDVLKTYFSREQKGLIFCVNISHSHEMANLLNEAGLSAKAVSGKTRDIDSCIEKFRNGEIQFLCSCNLLNEGWDVPEISVLVMARPTISKVLYQQQLGRGLRRSDTKRELFVIDVVDQYGALARPWSVHSLFGVSSYVPFGFLDRTYHSGDMVEVLGLSETVRSLIPVDITTFERTYEGYLDEEQAARELYVGTSTLRKWVKQGSVHADLIIPLGSRSVHYFHPDTLADIRDLKQLKTHSEATLKEDFLEFLEEKNYTFSFKMVFLLALIKHCNRQGEASLQLVLDDYRGFYRKRIMVGLPVDRPNCLYSKAFLDDTTALKRNMLANPFEKFERKRFVMYVRELSLIGFNPILFSQLSQKELTAIVELMKKHLSEYYQDMGGLVRD